MCIHTYVYIYAQYISLRYYGYVYIYICVYIHTHVYTYPGKHYSRNMLFNLQRKNKCHHICVYVCLIYTHYILDVLYMCVYTYIHISWTIIAVEMCRLIYTGKTWGIIFVNVRIIYTHYIHMYTHILENTAVKMCRLIYTG